MAEDISIQFTRFSAFYTPLIATIAGGFLAAEGFRPRHSVAPPGKSAIEGVVDGTVHVCQSAPSQAFGPIEKGQTPPAVHFAQINEMDGFFLTGREPDPAFSWDRLRGRTVLVDHGGQPLAMFKYACHRRGLDYAAIRAVNVPSAEMASRFAQGEGDYVHVQGPAPQQLEHEGKGHVVASGGHRPLRLLEPGRHPGLAGHGHGAPVHAGLSQGARLGAGDPCRRHRRGGGRILRGCGPRRPRRLHRHVPAAGLLDAARGDRPPGVRDERGCVSPRGADHAAAPVRGRGSAAPRRRLSLTRERR